MPSPEKSPYRNVALGADGTESHIPIIPFYKKGCQDKYLPCDGKAQGACRLAPVMKRDSVSFPFPQTHIAVATTPFSS